MNLMDARDAIDGTALPVRRELRIVPAQEVRRAWVLVRAGIEKALERTEVSFLVEDVYMACANATAVLMVAYVDDFYVGCVVATPAPGWRGPELDLWVCYNRGNRDVLETFQHEIAAYAKARGMVRLTGSSPRPGWERRMAQLGWRKASTTYELEI